MSARLALSLVPPALFSLGALLRLPRPGRPGTSATTSLALGCFAFGLTVNVDPVYATLDRVVGIPNVADLVEHVAVIVGATVLLGVLRAVHVPGKPRFPRTLVATATGVTATAVVLFAVAPLPVEAPKFTDRYAGVPAIRGYWAVQVVFLGVALVELIRISRYARSAGRSATRVGFRFIGAGAVIGIVYSANKLTALAAAALDPGGAAASGARVFDAPLLAVGTLAVGIGLLLPPAATVTRRGWEPLLYRWDVQVLRRLWLELSAVDPRLLLADTPSRREDLLDAANLATRRYRMVVEVLDAAAGLRNYVTPALDQAALDAAAGLAGPRRAAVVEAYWLAGARARYLAGAAPTPGRAAPLADVRAAEDEVARHLRRVARAWYRSRHVARFVSVGVPTRPGAVPPGAAETPLASQRTPAQSAAQQRFPRATADPGHRATTPGRSR